MGDDKESFWAWIQHKYPDWYQKVGKNPTAEDVQKLTSLMREWQSEHSPYNLPKSQ